MAAKRIAIIGSASPKREDELDLKNVDLAADACEHLGVALARVGFQIDVYNCGSQYIEQDVVRGFVKAGNAMDKSFDKSIVVHFPQGSGHEEFAELALNGDFFHLDRRPNDGWEASFYGSLADVDGVILLGGGRSTYVAGLVAITLKKAILACAAYGGAGEKVWNLLHKQIHSSTQEEISVMAGGEASEEWATKAIGILQSQIERSVLEKQLAEARVNQRIQDAVTEEQNRVRAELETKQNIEDSVKRHVGAFALLFILMLVSWGITFEITDVNFLAIALLIVTAFAGGAGATIKEVVANKQSKPSPTTAPQNVTSTIVMGIFVGFLSAALYLSGQWVAGAGSPEEINRYHQLSLIVVPTGLIAGFTLDKALGRLMGMDAFENNTSKTTPSNGE